MPYISTEHLFKCETCRHCIGETKCDTFCDTGEQYIPDMSKIPTADVVEVKHGEWIKTPCSEKDGDAHCSECNHWDWSDCKYCSECGAKMDGKLNCK